MPPSRYLVCAPTAGLLIVGWLIVFLVWPEGPGEHLAIGLLLGTLFGHTTFAAAWTAFGPGPLILRLPLSIAVVATVLVAFSLNVRRHNQPNFGIEIVLALCLLGQWVLVQLPLWGLGFLYGIHLRHHSSESHPTLSGRRQFGIRQLLVATTIVAVILGLGRVLIAGRAMTTPDTDIVIFAFLGGAAVVMSLPLLLAALVPRYAVQAVIGVALLIGVATLFELPLLQSLPNAGGPQTIDLIWINACTSAWILAFVVSARLCGYGLNVPVAGTKGVDKPAPPNLTDV